MGKRYTESQREAKRRYYLTHREELLEKAAANRAASREKRRLYARDYYKKNRAKHRACVERWFDKHPEKRREYRLRHRHGLTVPEWESILSTQNGNCPICMRVLDFTIKQGVHLDHCHESGIRRGLLCNQCNRGLGMFQDDPERFDRAAAYLRANGVTSHPGPASRTPARTAL